MNEVVAVDLEVVRGDVVPANLDVRRYVFEEARVQIACDHRPGWTDLFGEPPGDRPRTGAHFQAPPTRTDGGGPQVGDRGRVGPRLQQLQSRSLGIVGVLTEDVTLALAQVTNSRIRAATSSGFSNGSR